MALAGRVRVDGPAQVVGLVGQDADGPPVDASEGADHAGAEPAAELDHRPGSASVRITDRTS